ncbi:putative leader peptide [Streptomyces sp. NPDC029554]|uniref:putative leader peptide n=1 Tax=unclassified Streptomyces TaxID=2593676 RepID=UPI0033F2256A
MGGGTADCGSDTVRLVLRSLPLLTSRRHIDLARVSSAASRTTPRAAHGRRAPSPSYARDRAPRETHVRHLPDRRAALPEQDRP